MSSTKTKSDLYVTVADLMPTWAKSIRDKKTPVVYETGLGVESLNFEQGLVTLIGAAPGVGKTALTMQLVTEALRNNKTLTAMVCNIEMRPTYLLERQLAQLSGVDCRDIRHRRWNDPQMEAIERGLATLKQLTDRLRFVRPPYSMARIVEASRRSKASIVVVDYIQRLGMPPNVENRRVAVEEAMTQSRALADDGAAVIVVSAMGRSKEANGSTGYGAGMASFRESSELEYGADDAFVLEPKKGSDDVVEVKHHKSRYGQTQEVFLVFDKSIQRFTVDQPDEGDGDA